MPVSFTNVPQRHVCALQILQPKRRLTAMRNESSSTLNPQELIGRACSQSPPRGSRDASNRALSEGLVHSSSRLVWECVTAAESQCLCLPRAEP